MMTKNAPPPKVLIIHNQAEIYRDMLAAGAPGLRFAECTRYDDVPDALAREQPEVVLSFKFEPKPYPRAAILACPSVRWIQTAGAGIDHMAPWDPAKITLTNAGGIHGDLMSQYVLGVLMMRGHRFAEYAALQRERSWKRTNPTSLYGSTMTIVGMGKIGREIARRAAVFGIRIVGVNTTGTPVEGAERVYPIAQLRQAVAEADTVVLVVPLTPQTRGLIDAPTIAAMKKGAFLINVARGGVADEAAVVAALRSGQLSGAAFDVFTAEPLPADSPLWDAPNLLITPHSSSDGDLWQRDVAKIFIDNLARFRAGEPLRNVVDPARGY